MNKSADNVTPIVPIAVGKTQTTPDQAFKRSLPPPSNDLAAELAAVSGHPTDSPAADVLPNAPLSSPQKVRPQDSTGAVPPASSALNGHSNQPDPDLITVAKRTQERQGVAA